MSLLGRVFYIDDLIKHKGANGLKCPSVTEINDVVYDESNAEVCKLDLLFDESKLAENGKYPVVFNIHGGGWIVGDKRFRRGVSIQYASDGNFVINVNYALTPKYTYRDEIQNIFSALKWMLLRKFFQYPLRQRDKMNADKPPASPGGGANCTL